jgi:hypothetical protein
MFKMANGSVVSDCGYRQVSGYKPKLDEWWKDKRAVGGYATNRKDRVDSGQTWDGFTWDGVDRYKVKVTRLRVILRPYNGQPFAP